MLKERFNQNAFDFSVDFVGTFGKQVLFSSWQVPSCSLYCASRLLELRKH